MAWPSAALSSVNCPMSVSCAMRKGRSFPQRPARRQSTSFDLMAARRGERGHGGLRVTEVLLVTGGSRGIGAATALLAARKGYAVAVNYTSNEAAAHEVV